MLVEPDTEGDEDDVAGEAAPDAPPGAGKLRYSDADFLRLVRDERQRSIGFGDGDNGILAKVRIKAQEYRQGVINDLKVIKGRSTAVDSTLSDAVDTVMPDIMEVFFGGDDVVTFDADGEGDEDQARQESDVVGQVVFGQNDAFVAFHDAIQDGLLNRTGLWHWWWEEEAKPLGEQQGTDPVEATIIAGQLQQQKPWAQCALEENEDGSISMSFSELRGRVVFKAVPSEDFTVAADTVILRNTAYCALRDRPRIQDLIERGVDKALARSLPHFSTKTDQMEQARDEAGENATASADGLDDLRVVEVRTHFLRVDADDDGDIEIWRIETDAEETQLLQKECVTQIPFGALTPYRNAHRFYGESLYDKLQEVMRIKTVLLRMLLDSGYFALNQRMEVSEQASNEFTISDLLNNAPNVPVRSKDGQAVRPLSAGALGFDVFNAMEFMSTVAEGRSGVVRNAQGLNPNTLHDTAAGAMSLLSAAQKRVKFICRVIAETGVKDLVLGVHQMLRENSTDQHAPMNKKVGKGWAQVRPDDWSERQALTVHVGVGSANQAHDVGVQAQAIELTEKIIQLQAGVQGPFVTPANIFARLKAFSRAIGEKDPSQFWTDPTPAPGEPPMPAAAPHPSPEMAKAAMDGQLDQARLQAETAADAQRMQSEQQLAQARLEGELQIQREKMQGQLQLEREKAAQAIQLQREEMNATVDLKRQELAWRTTSSPNVADAVGELPGGMG